MSNVNQINEAIQPLTGPVKNTTKASLGGAFEALLNTALESSDGTDAASPVSELQELAAPRFDPETPSEIVTGKTDRLLDQLDDYAAQLGNPDVSLKSIAPVLEQLNTQAKDLIKETRYLAGQDDELKEIATRTAVAVQTKYVKFQRGDYLS